MRSFSKVPLAVITAVTMGVATFPQVAFSVFAADLILDLEIDRWHVGVLVTATSVTGAIFSPAFGRFTDRLGAVRSTSGVLLSGLICLGLIAASPTYVLLLGAVILSGVPQGWSNPATNALIVENTAPGGRGVVTGVKQSGVQMGTFLGGLFLPILGALWDWRLALAAFLVIPLGALFAMRGRTSQHRAERPLKRAEPSGPVPDSVKWIAVYGALSGLAISAIFTFLPLFAEEDLGWTGEHAGWLLAGVGLVGVIARISWGSASEAWLGHGRTLRLLAALSMLSSALLALAGFGVFPAWVVVPAAFLFASGAIAWNAVGMLAVMEYSPPSLVGRGTGVVLLGFLLGLGLGAPLMGFSVDRLGEYAPGWLVVAALFASCIVVAGRIHKTGTLFRP